MEKQLTKQGYEYVADAISHCIATSDTSHFIGEKIKDYCSPEMISEIYHKSLEYHQIFSIAISDLEIDMYGRKFYKENVNKVNKFLDSLTHRVFSDLCIFYPLK